MTASAAFNPRSFAERLAARKRASWSLLERPSTDEIILIADLLGLSGESLKITAARGLLFCATCRDGHRAFVVTDSLRLSATAYRLDGQLWEQTNRIARILPGSLESWPIGIAEAAPFPAIALVCDGLDLLAAGHLAWCANRENIITPVALPTIGAAIPNTTLPLFANKAICLFPHANKTGQSAKTKWGRQFANAGIEVEIYDFDGLTTAAGSPVATLTDFVKLCPDQWETHYDIIESAFTFGPALSAPA